MNYNDEDSVESLRAKNQDLMERLEELEEHLEMFKALEDMIESQEFTPLSRLTEERDLLVIQCERLRRERKRVQDEIYKQRETLQEIKKQCVESERHSVVDEGATPIVAHTDDEVYNLKKQIIDLEAKMQENEQQYAKEREEFQRLLREQRKEMEVAKQKLSPVYQALDVGKLGPRKSSLLHNSPRLGLRRKSSVTWDLNPRGESNTSSSNLLNFAGFDRELSPSASSPHLSTSSDMSPVSSVEMEEMRQLQQYCQQLCTQIESKEAHHESLQREQLELRSTLQKWQNQLAHCQKSVAVERKQRDKIRRHLELQRQTLLNEREQFAREKEELENLRQTWADARSKWAVELAVLEKMAEHPGDEASRKMKLGIAIQQQVELLKEQKAKLQKEVDVLSASQAESAKLPTPESSFASMSSPGTKGDDMKKMMDEALVKALKAQVEEQASQIRKLEEQRDVDTAIMAALREENSKAASPIVAPSSPAIFISNHCNSTIETQTSDSLAPTPCQRKGEGERRTSTEGEIKGLRDEVSRLRDEKAQLDREKEEFAKVRKELEALRGASAVDKAIIDALRDSAADEAKQLEKIQKAHRQELETSRKKADELRRDLEKLQQERAVDAAIMAGLRDQLNETAATNDRYIKKLEEEIEGLRKPTTPLEELDIEVKKLREERQHQHNSAAASHESAEMDEHTRCVRDLRQELKAMESQLATERQNSAEAAMKLKDAAELKEMVQTLENQLAEAVANLAVEVKNRHHAAEQLQEVSSRAEAHSQAATAAQEEVKRLEAELEKAVSQHKVVTEQRDSLEGLLRDAEGQCKEAQEAAAAAEARREELEEQIKALKEVAAATATEETKELKEAAAAAEARKGELEEQIKELKEASTAATEEIKELQAAVAAAETRKGELEEELKELKKAATARTTEEIKELQEATAAAEARKGELEEEIKELKEARAAQEGEAKEAREAAAAAEARVRELEEQIKVLQEAAGEAQEEEKVQEIRAAATAAEARASELEEQLKKANEKLETSRVRITELEALLEKSEKDRVDGKEENRLDPEAARRLEELEAALADEKLRSTAYSDQLKETSARLQEALVQSPKLPQANGGVKSETDTDHTTDLEAELKAAKEELEGAKQDVLRLEGQLSAEKGRVETLEQLLKKVSIENEPDMKTPSYTHQETGVTTNGRDLAVDSNVHPVAVIPTTSVPNLQTSASVSPKAGLAGEAAALRQEVIQLRQQLSNSPPPAAKAYAEEDDVNVLRSQRDALLKEVSRTRGSPFTTPPPARSGSSPWRRTPDTTPVLSSDVRKKRCQDWEQKHSNLENDVSKLKAQLNGLSNAMIRSSACAEELSQQRWHDDQLSLKRGYSLPAGGLSQSGSPSGDRLDTTQKPPKNSPEFSPIRASSADSPPREKLFFASPIRPGTHIASPARTV